MAKIEPLYFTERVDDRMVAVNCHAYEYRRGNLYGLCVFVLMAKEERYGGYRPGDDQGLSRYVHAVDWRRLARERITAVVIDEHGGRLPFVRTVRQV